MRGIGSFLLLLAAIVGCSSGSTSNDASAGGSGGSAGDGADLSCALGATQACTCADGSSAIRQCVGVWGQCECVSQAGGAPGGPGGQQGLAGSSAGAGVGPGGSGGSVAGGGSGGAANAGSGGSSAGSGGEPDAIAYCAAGCTTATDCDLGIASANADNYACVAGACEYTGCNSDQECQQDSPTTVCRAGAGVGYDSCVTACQSVDDCVLGVPIYDQDNWDCQNGACAYTGCTGDSECSSYAPGTECLGDGSNPPQCLEPCTTADDCALGVPAYDASHYACDQGVCRYTGCVSDAECDAVTAGTVCHQP